MIMLSGSLDAQTLFWCSFPILNSSADCRLLAPTPQAPLQISASWSPSTSSYFTRSDGAARQFPYWRVRQITDKILRQIIPKITGGSYCFAN